MSDVYSRENLKVACASIENGGYFFIVKVEKYLDRDIAVVEVRGKDPLMSSVSKFKVDIRDITECYEDIKNKVNHNFNVVDDNFYLPNGIGFEKYNYTSTVNLCEGFSSLRHTLKTPVEVLWELICGDYRFIWDGCECVPCNFVYFGDDNFSIKVSHIGTDGKPYIVDIIKYESGKYKYSDLLIVPNEDVEYNMNPESLFGHIDYTKVKDDFGRIRNAFKLNLKRFETNMYNQDKFDKVYSREYSIAVIDTMYKIASYLNGLCMILKDIGGNCGDTVIPCKSNNSFVVNSNVQHNTFTIQNIYYSYEIIGIVKQLYMENVQDLTTYLRIKDQSLRENIYNKMIECIGSKFGDLTHYFVNGVLDALAIQKGDKRTRRQILTDYFNTVYKEFLMYGFYFYDLRTMFIRNNYRIEKEFNDTFLINRYSGNYFRVG